MIFIQPPVSWKGREKNLSHEKVSPPPLVLIHVVGHIPNLVSWSFSWWTNIIIYGIGHAKLPTDECHDCPLGRQSWGGQSLISNQHWLPYTFFLLFIFLLPLFLTSFLMTGWLLQILGVLVYKKRGVESTITVDIVLFANRIVQCSFGCNL